MRLVGGDLVFVGDDPRVRTVVDAMRMRALDALELSIDEAALAAALRAATGSARARGPRRENRLDPSLRALAPREPSLRSLAARRVNGSAAERWACFVLAVAHAESDLRTVGEWARLVGVSRSVLAETCRLVHVAPHEARDFARLLRAVLRAGPIWEPESFLSCGDARTLGKLLALGGFGRRRGGPPPTPREFLHRQSWIPRESAALGALEALLDA